ncbi:hypothetical protein AMS62_05425 [Bacillus sp. FJAT-18019]|nr:hypothetical protein AMS62_05425 [Bacillus sp. FJAT-18019]
MGVRGDHVGKIYFWDHENELTAKIMLNETGYEAVTVDDYWENVSLVAETFLDFIKSFEIVEGQEELEIESKIVSVRMSDTFMAEMLAARAKLESKERTKGKR